MTAARFSLISPTTLAVTHICEGEEVVTGGDDGQVYVASFVTATSAEGFIMWARQRGCMIIGVRQPKSGEPLPCDNCGQGVPAHVANGGRCPEPKVHP